MMLGEEAAHKQTNENTRFLAELLQMTLYTYVLKVYINFQRKIKTFKNITKINNIIPLKVKYR